LTFSNLEEKKGSKEEIKKELEKIQFVQDCFIDTDLELMFPESYISNVSERLRLYRDLDNVHNEQELALYEEHLTDRFGTIPEQGRELLTIIPLRWIAIRLGFEKIIIRDRTMILHFISDQESPYFKSPVFAKVLNYIGRYPEQFMVKELKEKLTLRVKSITSVKDAQHILHSIHAFTHPVNNSEDHP